LFDGYLPRRGKERRQRLSQLTGEERTLIFFEAPHRLIESIGDMAGVFGHRRVVMARELTKMHEEMVRGNLAELLHRVQKGGKPRGEIVLVVEGCKSSSTPGGNIPESVADALHPMPTHKDLSRRDTIRAIAQRYGLSRNEAYRKMVKERQAQT
jgi:16S rRNA (cytidine1402-2'-O)-methyltransferase